MDLMKPQQVLHFSALLRPLPSDCWRLAADGVRVHLFNLQNNSALHPRNYEPHVCAAVSR